jgi:hypothetical protein
MKTRSRFCIKLIITAADHHFMMSLIARLVGLQFQWKISPYRMIMKKTMTMSICKKNTLLLGNHAMVSSHPSLTMTSPHVVPQITRN